jgi:hypothetical protein
MYEKIEVAEYWNVHGIGIAVVAVVHYFEEAVFDWAAYIGGSPRGAMKKQYAVEDAFQYGEKLSERQAHFFFPHLPIKKYRQ